MNNDYPPLVFDSTATDFPFVAEMPRAEKTRWQKIRDAFCEAYALQKEHGWMVPRKAAADFLDVSVQRVDELERDGRLRRVVLHGHPYITANSIEAYAKIERKLGRPFKTVAACASSPLAAYQVAKKSLKK
jgi:hypothetical protein